MPADSQASVRMLDAESQAEAVIVAPKKQEPSKLPKKSEVAVEVSFVKPKGTEANYVAIVKMRTIPLLLLLGNIVVLIILLIGSYFGIFWWLYIGPEYPVTPKGLGLVYRIIRCGVAGSALYYALNHKVEPCDRVFEFVCERWIHEPSDRYQRVVLGAEMASKTSHLICWHLMDWHLMEETYNDMRDIVQSTRLLSHGSRPLVNVDTLHRVCQNKNSSDLNYFSHLKNGYRDGCSS